MAEKDYLNFLGIIGYDLEFLIENNDIFYYTCEINHYTDYIEIYAEPSDKSYTLKGDIGVLSVHKGVNNFIINLLENDVLLKTFDISVVIKKWKRTIRKKAVEKPAELNIQEDLEEKKQEHMPPPRLLSLSVSNGVLEPDFNADLFEYRIKRKKNKNSVTIHAEGEMAEYIVGGDIGEQRLPKGERMLCITCSSQDHSLEMTYHLLVESVTRKRKEKKIPDKKIRNKKAESPPIKKRTKKTKRIKKSGNHNGMILLFVLLCILTVAASLFFAMPIRNIYKSRKQQSLELSQRREEITEYLGGEYLPETLENYIQEIEAFSQHYPNQQDEKELLKLLDVWTRECALRNINVTVSQSERVTQKNVEQIEKNAGKTLLMNRRVTLEAGGKYEDLMRLYEMIYEDQRTILVDNIELKKNQEDTEADTWIIGINMIFYYYAG